MMEGLKYRHKELGENFTIVDLEDWAPEGHEYGSMWVALQQFEDGVCSDENAEAIAKNFDFQRIGTGPTLKDACKDREHNFVEEDIRKDQQGTVICENCGLSSSVLRELTGHEIPVVCDFCGRVDYCEFLEDDKFICLDCKE